MNKDKVIAIDGPSGSGKSTVAKEVAEQLQVLYIDTGAMFRGIACYLDGKGIEIKPSAKVDQALKDMDFKYGISKEVLIQIDGQNLTEMIREHHVSYLASQVSKIPSVRSYLLSFQRKLPQENVCVMEGRDIGTIVFPEAFSKFFVSASLEVRAKRRFEQLKEKGQKDLSFDQVLSDVKDRDERDSNREVAPLKKADDAEYIDSSHANISEVTNDICQKVKNKAKQLGLNL